MASKLTEKDLEDEIVLVMKYLMVVDINEIHDYLITNREKFLQVIEEAYNYWRKLQRVSVLYTHN